MFTIILNVETRLNNSERYQQWQLEITIKSVILNDPIKAKKKKKMTMKIKRFITKFDE